MRHDLHRISLLPRMFLMIVIILLRSIIHLLLLLLLLLLIAPIAVHTFLLLMLASSFIFILYQWLTVILYITMTNLRCLWLMAFLRLMQRKYSFFIIAGQGTLSDPLLIVSDDSLDSIFLLAVYYLLAALFQFLDNGWHALIATAALIIIWFVFNDYLLKKLPALITFCNGRLLYQLSYCNFLVDFVESPNPWLRFLGKQVSQLLRRRRLRVGYLTTTWII